MRILITGAQGQLGHELIRSSPEGFDTVGMGAAELDICDIEQVAIVIAELQPDLIINAAAYTAVDKAETEVEAAWAVNCDGVIHLAIAAERMNIPLMHVSTDYVFAGDSREPYRECDPTGPTGVYGSSKLEGELALVAKCSRHIILRTSWVFAARGDNFVKTMLRLGLKQDQLGVVADQHGGPTSASSISRALWTLAMQFRNQGSLNWGTYHFSGAPACTWHEFALEIFRQGHQHGLIPKMPEVRSIETVEYPTPAKRPAWSVMDCSKLREAHGIVQPDWRKDLTDVLVEMAGSS